VPVEIAAPTLLDEFTARHEWSLHEQVEVRRGPAETYTHLAECPRKLFCGLAFPLPLRPRAGTPGFDEILARAPWTMLGHRPGSELVFGVAGRFWTSFCDWETVGADEFPAYSRRRRGTLAIALTCRPFGDGHTLLAFEARATTTDAIAHRWADWYWRTISPTARLAVHQVLRRAAG
jgi:hypothetical protein